MGRLQERERQLEAELRLARESSASIELDEATVTNMLGEETIRVLQTARESASQIKIRAEENAARTVREAADEANRLRQEAEIEAARRRQDATSDAEAEVALAKQQGREMVNEARAYRERVLADLDRRTTLARHQIEELIHGRDRLLQVFERARLVAVDVTSELRAVDTPDELVNLTPTTGPVPIMVPNERRPARAEEPELSAGNDPDVIDVVDTDADVDVVEAEAPVAAIGEADVIEAATTVVDDGDDGEAAAESAEIEAPAASDDSATAEVDVTEADDTEAEVEAEGDGDAGEAAVPDAATDVRRDTNVVSLFRDRQSPADVAIADDHPSTEGELRDIGGLFERLRQETAAETAETEIEAEIDDGADAGVATTIADDAGVVAAPSAFSRRDEVIVPLIVSAARRLKRVLADEQNEALDTLRQKEPVTTLDDMVPELDEHVAQYLGSIEDELAGAAAAGAAELGAKDTKSLRSKLAKAGALAGAHEQVRAALVGPLRERLGRAITDGGGDNDDITKRVRAVYREWKTQHIDDQLDDVFRRAFSGGLSVTIEPGTPLTWTVDPQAAPCPDCEDNSLAGSVPAGDAFPTGHTSAPAHPGCRCLALPAE
jgi:hypothetical protein